MAGDLGHAGGGAAVPAFILIVDVLLALVVLFFGLCLVFGRDFGLQTNAVC